MRFCILILFVLLMFAVVGKQQANAAPQSTLAVITAGDAICGGLFFNRPGRICPGPNCPTPNGPGPPPEVAPPPIPTPEPESVEPVIANVIVDEPKPEPEPESDISWILVAFAGLASMIGFYAMEASS